MAIEMNEVQTLWCTGILSVLAIVAAPVIALDIQRRLERSKLTEDRKQAIFKALWVNRRRPFYLARVDALNMIDVEFFKERKVRDAWLELFAHYRDPHPGISEAQISSDREELFYTLLFEISNVLGYGFPRAFIRDNFYRPELHGRFDEMEFETRQRVLDLLRSDALPVRFVPPTEPNQPNKPVADE